MRWWVGILGLISSGVLLAGCQQTCFVQEPDLFEAHQRLHLPPAPESDIRAGIVPYLPRMTDPATVVDPDRKPHYLTLHEAFALALENGTSGVQAVRSPGVPIDDLVTFTGVGVAGSDRLRVFALAPAINAANMEAALARFDAVWLSSMNWIVNDNPVQGLNSFTNGEQGQFSTALVKPLATGGVAGITFNANYLDLRTPPTGFFFLNPSYTSTLQLGFEQPLLRYAGTAINQVTSAFPSSLVFPGINARQAALSSEGILITRVRFDQQRAEFERRINFTLLNVEVAYWNLYGSYVSLFSADQALRQAHESWRILKEQYDVGKADPVQLTQVRYQYENFRINRLTALDTVLENERTLRIFLGMKMEDGERLVPADAPTLAPYVPNWQAAFEDALSLRPELVLAREDVKAKQLALIAAKTLLQPDLRLTANYSLVGLGSRLDGGGYIAPGSPISFNSLNTLASGNFANWNVGLNLIVPIGFRNEMAQVRAARLALAQTYEVLKDQENKAHNFLARQYREVIANYKIIEARRLYRQTVALELQILTTKVEAGVLLPTDRGTFGDSLLDAQRLWAAALSDEYTSIVNYNNALALFEFAKGSIQQHDRVFIAEGPLPKTAQVRAVEHERERARAIVLNERANPFIQHSPESRLTPQVSWPEQMAPPLPALWQDGPPMGKNNPVAPPTITSPPVLAPVPPVNDKNQRTSKSKNELVPDYPRTPPLIPAGTGPTELPANAAGQTPPLAPKMPMAGPIRLEAMPAEAGASTVPRLGSPGPMREITFTPLPPVQSGSTPTPVLEPPEEK